MSNLCRSIFASLSVLAAGFAVPALATPQFTFLDANYVQEIYTGPLVGGPGMTWTSSGNLLTLNGSDILEYSPTQNANYQGTPIHGVIATHSIAGLNGGGTGFTMGHDGMIYVNTPGGLQRVDPLTWGPAVTLTSTNGTYGITTLPDGRIAYDANNGGTSNAIYVYDPSAATNTLIYTGSALIDDIEASSTGQIALADHDNAALIIISIAGNVLSTTSAAHFPDGLAFGDGVNFGSVFSNNNDGTITQFVFGSGFGAPATAQNLIASGSLAYGDLAAVGPDCAFYVSQFTNNNLNGSVAPNATHWDNGVDTSEPSIIRIAAKDSRSCAFAPSGGQIPEPSSLPLVLAGLLPLLGLSMLRVRALAVATRRPRPA